MVSPAQAHQGVTVIQGCVEILGYDNPSLLNPDSLEQPLAASRLELHDRTLNQTVLQDLIPAHNMLAF